MDRTGGNPPQLDMGHLLPTGQDMGYSARVPPDVTDYTADGTDFLVL